MNIYKYLSLVLGLPKTIYINFKYFKFKDAIKLPILVSSNVILNNVAGEIVIDAPLSTGMIKIGFGHIGIFDIKHSHSIYDVNGKVIFKGNANIGHGSKISVNKKGTMILGNNFNISAETSIICNKKISFGNDCLLSWDILIMDTDFHKIINNVDKKIINTDKEIIIGNSVWIGCRCTVLKGVSIPNNTVVSANSHIYKSFYKENTIIGGNPCEILKYDISWEL